MDYKKTYSPSTLNQTVKKKLVEYATDVAKDRNKLRKELETTKELYEIKERDLDTSQADNAKLFEQNGELEELAKTLKAEVDELKHEAEAGHNAISSYATLCNKAYVETKILKGSILGVAILAFAVGIAIGAIF